MAPRHREIVDDRPLLSPRVYSGIAVIFGILGIVMIAWWMRGIAEATQLFELLQGVLLATITFLWGSQQIERANARADEAATQKAVVAGAADGTRRAETAIEADVRSLRRILQLLAEDPAVREKVEAAVRQVEGE